jgi:hypothetical protein
MRRGVGVRENDAAAHVDVGLRLGAAGDEEGRAANQRGGKEP